MVQDDKQIAKDKAVEAKNNANEAQQEAVQALHDSVAAIHKAENIAKTSKEPSEFALREAKEAIILGEKARIEAEEARSKAEYARGEAEGARGKAEQSRSLAEEMRNKAEKALQVAHAAQEQARRAEERYHLVIEGSDEGLWDWDIEKGTVYWNGRFFQMLGIENITETPTEADLFERVHPEDQKRLRDVIQYALKTSKQVSEQFRVRSFNGHYIHCCLRGKTIFDEQGKAIRMAGMISDISERIEAQEKLQQYASMLEQSNKDLEQFSAIASHDLQAPLRKVKTFAENLEKKTKELLTPESLDDLQRMNRAISSMQRLIDDLLNFSKVSQGEKLLKMEPIDLLKVLTNAQVDLKDQIEQKKADIEIGALCQVQGDASLLTQLFQNVLQNALKYLPQERKPQISIASKNIDNGFCEVSVQDNGIGFDPKDAEHIFGIFERLHNKSRYAGTGIGLAICRRIAERHGGSIRADSKPGVGSRFIVQLPLA